MKPRSMMLGLAATMASLAPAAASAAETVGRISSVSGNSFVARDGRLLRAVPSMRLVKGDRIVTQAGGSARARLARGCDLVVGASESASVASCGRTTGFGQGGQAVGGGASGAASGGGLGGGTIAVAVGALAAIVLGVAAAANGGTSPNSP